MKVALVQCPAFGIDKPPLALGYLSAFLKKKGYEVSIFDLNADLYSKVEQEDKKFWEFKYIFEWMQDSSALRRKLIQTVFLKKWVEKILSCNADIIGYSIQSSSLAVSIDLAKEIKRLVPDKTIIFGGPLNLCYSNEHSYYLLQLENVSKTKVVDIVVLGEGEKTLFEILKRIESKSSIRGCLGTIILENEEIVDNGPRPLINDLDAVPFPEFDEFLPLYKYKNRLPILASRGCINRCVFCDDTLMWRYYRARSPENIIEEMRMRKAQGVEFLEFNDLLVNGDLKQLRELCNLLLKEKLGISWGGSACINRYMDFSLLKKLRKAGCCYLNYGIESASPRVLRRMGKGFTIKEAEKVLKNTYKAGISACTNWIVGFPNETYEDFRETLAFVKRNIKYLKNNIMVNSFILKYSSSLFEDKEKFGVVTEENWNWHSQGGKNTETERKRRYDEFLQLISELDDKPAHETFQG